MSVLVFRRGGLEARDPGGVFLVLFLEFSNPCHEGFLFGLFGVEFVLKQADLLLVGVPVFREALFVPFFLGGETALVFPGLVVFTLGLLRRRRPAVESEIPDLCPVGRRVAVAVADQKPPLLGDYRSEDGAVLAALVIHREAGHSAEPLAVFIRDLELALMRRRWGVRPRQELD